MKYFHELTKKEFRGLVKKKITWGELEKIHPQPKWCSYPDALHGLAGCWSLVGQMVTGEDYCKKCDCYEATDTKGK